MIAVEIWLQLTFHPGVFKQFHICKETCITHYVRIFQNHAASRNYLLRANKKLLAIRFRTGPRGLSTNKCNPKNSMTVGILCRKTGSHNLGICNQIIYKNVPRQMEYCFGEAFFDLMSNCLMFIFN